MIIALAGAVSIGNNQYCKSKKLKESIFKIFTAVTL
jgi:hypothetical protein